MKEETKEKAKYVIPLLPIIIFSSIVPLIVYAKFSYLSKFMAASWMGQPVSADVFSYYKMILIIACAALALIIMIKRLIKAELKVKLSVPLLVAAIYGVFILLSIIFSEYASVALWGAPERYEGGVVLISYMIMFIYAVSILDNIKSIKLVINFMLISSSVIFIIGLLQFFGFDIFASDFFRSLINMKASAHNPYDLKLFVEPFASYGTLYNSNHFSLYISILFPLTLAFYSTKKLIGKKILGILLVFLSIMAFIGGNSSGGYFAAVITIVLLLFLAFPYIKKNVKNIIILSVSVLCLLVAVNFLSGGRVAKNLRISSITNEEDRILVEGKKIFINNIELGDKEILIDTAEYDFLVVIENESIRVFDSAGNQLDTTIKINEKQGVKFKYTYTFNDERYTNYSVAANADYSVVTVFAGSRVMWFHMTESGVMVPGMNNTLDIIHDVERNPLLYKIPQLFSGRGYIWSGMFPLLRDTVIIGNGPDTTFLTYPQYDYIGKINMRGTFNVVIEKPHCYYIQIAHDTGWISLFLLFALFAYYIVDTFIVLFKFKPHGLNKTYSLSVLCGVIAYLFASIMYDSSVLTAPVFWTVIAIGFVLNRINRKTSGVSFG